MRACAMPSVDASNDPIHDMAMLHKATRDYRLYCFSRHLMPTLPCRRRFRFEARLAFTLFRHWLIIYLSLIIFIIFLRLLPHHFHISPYAFLRRSYRCRFIILFAFICPLFSFATISADGRCFSPLCQL
jgi:hypothetical protein